MLGSFLGLAGRIAAFRAPLSVLAAAGLLALAPAAFAWEPGTDGVAPVPSLAGRVTDLTGTLTAAQRSALEAKLADWEARTTNQLAVLLVPSTQPEPIEAFSIRVADAWKIGRKGNDNGALLVVAKNDRKIRIEVGYGFEGTLTDVTSSRIIREDIAPRFRDGNFAAGIEAGVDRIIAVVAEGKPLPPPSAGNPRRSGGGGLNIESLLVILFIAVPVVGGILRSIFGRLGGSTIGAGIVAAGAWIVAGSIVVAVIAAIVGFIVMIFLGSGGGMVRRGGGWMPTGGGGSSWGGGGGSSGGGFSGGGGSFGGGGASGNW